MSYDHLALLLRFDRALKLREAIFEAVKEGDFAVDAGCGTGLLSLWAAQAGAKRVLAIDVADLTTAELLAEENGYLDQIEFKQSNLSEVQQGSDEDCDVLMAMVYFIDPRRDEKQHALTHKIRCRLLKENGQQIPDKVEYLAYAAEWNSQDINTRYSDIDKKVKMMEGRYNLSLKSLAKSAKSRVNLSWFPDRNSSGLLNRPGARLLSPETHFTTIDYTKPVQAYPNQISFNITSEGTVNVIIFQQNLYYKQNLIFSNESVCWIRNPLFFKSNNKITASIDDTWRQKNVLTLQKLS